MMLCTSSSVYYLALNIEWLDIRFKKKKKKKGKKEKEHIHFVSARPPIANPGGGVATPYGTGGAITPRVCCG